MLTANCQKMELSGAGIVLDKVIGNPIAQLSMDSLPVRLGGVRLVNINIKIALQETEVERREKVNKKIDFATNHTEPKRKWTKR